jgi:hypothetical protein
VKPVEPSLILPRLSEAGDEALSGAIADLRQHGPDATELASLASRLALQGLAVSPVSPSVAARAPWKKLALAGGGGASVVALWLSLSPPSPAPRAAPPPASKQLVSARAPSVSPPPAPLPAPRARSIAAPPTSATAEAANSVAAPPLDLPAPASSSPLRPAAPTPVAAEPIARVEPGTSAARRALLPAPAATVSPQGPYPEATAAAPTEIELLREARQAIRQSPSKALELAEAHARAYPAGKLVQERELIAISALVALERRTAALVRANRFERAFPGSPYRKQIGELLR